MTKKEIKDLIIKSDYKNKEVVIWWRWRENKVYGNFDKAVAFWDGYHFNVSDSNYVWDFDKLVDEVYNFSKCFGVKFKILEVDND